MATASAPWPRLLERLLEGEQLLPSDAAALMEAWLAEELTPVQTGAFLASLRARGARGGELAAMAGVLRRACPLPCARPEGLLVDTCGTGGDGADTFNISTAVAFTAAACGAVVAKHGNRSASGRVGSADVLEGLGLRLQADARQVVEALPAVGVTFLFAPAWHPALVNLAPLRRSLGVRTVFNLLGPLVNPLLPDGQVLGVARADLLDPMAEALQQLGQRRAVVVHGAGGLDEASLAGPNAVRIVEEGRIRAETLAPGDFGLREAPLSALKGGDLELNQAILRELLQGRGSEAQRDVVAFNTALVLWVAGVEMDLRSGVDRAITALAEGRAWKRLEQLRQALDPAEEE
jgi:anthranilate phosphoribosyltransferase